MNIVTIVNDLHVHGQIYRGFWFTHYYAFCAVVVLYVYTIQRRSHPQSTWKEYFSAASRCQQQIHALRGKKDSLALRYSIVLEELRIEASKQTDEALKITKSNASKANNARDAEVAYTILQLANNEVSNNNSSAQITTVEEHQQGQDLNDTRQYNSFVLGPAPSNSYIISSNFMGQSQQPCDIPSLEFPASISENSPGSIMDNWTSWNEFDSFVTGGVIGLGDGQYFDELQTTNDIFEGAGLQ
ncbi:hypothetical protein VE03_05200 [Pseudogymnoascus sp. 23342-1-I1]|nr:hypothetical protein VE03_05200 [Pseudogymnoascus sp. 23342-1-I1]